MREVGIGYSGHEKLRHRAALQGKPQLLASRYSMDLEKKKLEKDVEYTADGEVIALKSISTAVKKRIKHIGPNATKAALISVDKGDGRVLSTISFPYRHQGKSIPEVPCSTTNHLILKAWAGEDTYTTLSDRLADVHNVIAVELGLPTFVGAQHTGSFAWRHRILGAMAEEGLESLHSTIKEDIENVARGDLVERARIAIQRWGVQVQLADLGKNVD
uniref:Uncharacterized protein n=1 Tax=Acrobeloides nanus TaxID=290746 RepID=A0A914CZW5_9BILA